MNSSWIDELWQDRNEFAEDPIGSFYCPYTNGAVCALLVDGRKPQDLCHDLECNQLKYVRPRQRRHKRAA